MTDLLPQMAPWGLEVLDLKLSTCIVLNLGRRRISYRAGPQSRADDKISVATKKIRPIATLQRAHATQEKAPCRQQLTRSGM